MKNNNNGANYVFSIEHPDTALLLIEDIPLHPVKRLRKSYIISKKIKLAIYKLLVYIPKLISGNYKRKKINNETN